MKRYYKTILAAILIIAAAALSIWGISKWKDGKKKENETSEVELSQMEYIEPEESQEEKGEEALLFEHETDPGGGEVDPKYIQEMPDFDVTITGIDDTLMDLIDGDVEGLTKAVNELLTSDPYYGWTDKAFVYKYEDAQKMGCCRIFLKVGDAEQGAHVMYDYESKTFKTKG